MRSRPPPRHFLMYLVFGFCSAPASAAGDAEWFAAVKASLGRDTIDGISDRGSIGTGVLIGDTIDGQLEDDEVDDYTAGVGFALGRRMGFWSISAEYVWRYRTDWDVVASTPAIQTITNVFSNVETSTLMLNVARRGPINRHWSWEVGAGIGLAVQKLESTYVEREVPGISAEQKFKDDAGDTEFSYNVFAGLSRDLGGPWSLNVRYRYIDLGELQAGPFPNRAARVFADHTAQELQLSVERDF